jgi:putative transposase
MQAWHHAPFHELSAGGAYMVTGGTFEKRHHLSSAARLDRFMNSLHAYATKYDWILQAWSVFSNHYHFVGIAPGSAKSLPKMINELHSGSAEEINGEDGIRGRKVWFNYWESHIDFERSYLARLNYVNTNPVKHGLVRVASQYPWCSAAWFESSAPKSFVSTVSQFKTDRLNVLDPFEPQPIA